MNNQTNHFSNNLYQLNSDLKPQQLFDAVSACLSKAEALTSIATTIDMEIYTSEVVNNYLWALGDIIREAKCLHKELCVQNNSIK
jgi:hypothetical protein